MNYDEAHEKLHEGEIVVESVEPPTNKAIYRAGWDKKGWISVVKEATDVGVHLDTAHVDKVVFYDADDATGSYEEYVLTDEDKDATDWYVWGEGPVAEEAEAKAKEEGEAFVPDVEGGAGEPAPLESDEPVEEAPFEDLGPVDEPEDLGVDEYPGIDDSDSYPEDVLEDDGSPVVPLDEHGGPAEAQK